MSGQDCPQGMRVPHHLKAHVQGGGSCSQKAPRSWVKGGPHAATGWGWLRTQLVEGPALRKGYDPGAHFSFRCPGHSSSLSPNTWTT